MDDRLQPIVRMEAVSHCFADGSTGLSRVSLDVAPGEFVVLCGKNGSGKTTLIRHMNALLLPTKGVVLVAGKDTRKHPANARRMVGMVFSDADAQIVGETVADDAAFGPENLGMPHQEVKARVEAALSAVGLSHLAHRPPHLLSGGEKRRLAIAGVLAVDPGVVVFDEPFSNLDFPGIVQVLEQMERLRARGVALVVATHELEKVAAMADRLVVLDQGRIAAKGPFAEVAVGLEAFGVRTPPAAGRGGFDPWHT
ncbi:MAG: ABC transporter ATP-binding protein [Deltaproteobacteria bacterium]|nr:ABC transporter ATP-binding protein [Deltaproteobacteria bacterium]